ncbi:HAAS domain-containing protein [Alkalicoccobacillus murimartini]|uniref:DNA-binding ferritin-like protein (Dps family)/heme/copper-type cytochrome/quinol oxidase subunit 4 n=1 Tax=Alkalicoccobacillus murimartini TaxID=171685 RepID=A0ABT9YC68_9BACI|nr:hypothetical protein [Alkalicoccobacillus murimartini]MDQ0205446.1 DNA-binding ferritin-like protein (Dps family)/heme/copper-type cytochrome/quinol oxidase subunit 4 [Alkalicoccobacillus murimartini]
MSVHSTLSKESQTFLENLRVYLFSSGKQSDEIDGIVAELENHLHEAEEAGKPIEKIVGDSPKAYMESLSSEMKVDMKTWMKYIAMIILGAFSFRVLSDFTRGSMAYSTFELIGHIVTVLLSIPLLLLTMKYLASNSFSTRKEILVLLPAAIIPAAMFMGVIFMDTFVTTPIIELNTLSRLVTVIITILFVIYMAVWSKSLLLPICILLLIAPEYLLSFTALQEASRLIIGLFITYAGLLIYMGMTMKKSKSENSAH